MAFIEHLDEAIGKVKPGPTLNGISILPALLTGLCPTQQGFGGAYPTIGKNSLAKMKKK
ncbi:MAG: hypothetical protein QNK35_03120 [Bacteroides sp.]|nr:hypothetical protein [Bacteroides sp.]